MWFLRIFGFGCEITKSADSDIDTSSHEEFSVNKNVGLPAVLHGFQLSNSKHQLKLIITAYVYIAMNDDK